MKELNLTNSNEVALVDDEDFERLSKFKWRVSGAGSGRIERWFAVYYKTRHISLAAEVMQNPKQMFDHINRNPYDNRKINIRACTYTQNNANRTKQNGTSSQYKGVCWDKHAGCWKARICVNKIIKHLGRFINEDDAARAYNTAACIWFRDFANYNVIKQAP